VIEKGTEVGVDGFEPFVAERSVVREVSENKWTRWRRVAKEATEQCRRSEVPRLFPLRNGVGELTLQAEEVGIVWDPHGMPIDAWWHAQQPPRRIKVVNGPEGGLSAGELSQLRDQGFAPVRLGPRIFRAENAGIFGALLIQFLSGELTAELP
jgi:16S rRNA (uracil1498-N3)-methyltransferase